MRMTVLQTQDNQLPTRGAGIAIALGAETVVVGILLVQAIWNLTAAAYLLLCVKVQGDPVGVRGFEAPASASRIMSTFKKTLYLQGVSDKYYS
jgi:hypothetical protein